MPFKIPLIILFSLFFSSTSVICQTNNNIDTVATDTISTSQNPQNIYRQHHEEDDEFNLFLLLLAVAGISFMIGFVMPGMAAFLLMVLLIVLLVTTGIIPLLLLLAGQLNPIQQV